MARYCTNCGKQIPEDVKFCPYCGAKAFEEFSGGKPSNSGHPVTPTPKKNNSIKVGNFLIPILVMIVGGWIGGYVALLIMPQESVVHVATLIYLFLSEIYIYVHYKSLDAKEGEAASRRFTIVMLSGIADLVFAFFSYSLEDITLAFVFFFVALALMILSSILDTITP